MSKEDIKPINTDSVITISNLIDQRSIYTLTPPYQRGDVWSNDWKIDLIEVIFGGLPLAPVTLVQKENEGEIEYLVLDGKQRMLTVFDFIDDRFEYPVVIDGKSYPYKYSDLVKISKDKKHKHHTKLQKCYSSFKNYNFKAVIYPNIDWRAQIKLFEKINHSKQLSKYEKFNSSYIFTKSFADFVFNNYIKKCSDYLYETKRLYKEGKDLTFKFRVITGIMGSDAENPIVDWEAFPADALRDEFKKFMASLNSKFETYMKDKDDQYLFDSKDRVQKMFEDFKWNELTNNFKNFDKVFTMVSGLNKKNYVYSLLYFSLFIMRQIEEQKLTPNMIEKERSLLKKLYQDYHNWTADCKTDQKRVSRAGSIPGKAYHMAKLKEIFDGSTLDLGKKNQPFSDEERAAIFEAADGKCEICGSDQDLEVDHVNPGSRSSTKIGGLLCRSHNQLKADNTKQDLKEINDYMSKKIGSIAA